MGENEFLPRVQQRGAEIIKARGASSASSAARAACETVRAVEHPTRSGDVFNAAIMSDGAYDIPAGIFSGFPLSDIRWCWQCRNSSRLCAE